MVGHSQGGGGGQGGCWGWAGASGLCKGKAGKRCGRAREGVPRAWGGPRPGLRAQPRAAPASKVGSLSQRAHAARQWQEAARAVILTCVWVLINRTAEQAAQCPPSLSLPCCPPPLRRRSCALLPPSDPSLLTVDTRRRVILDAQVDVLSDAKACGAPRRRGRGQAGRLCTRAALHAAEGQRAPTCTPGGCGCNASSSSCPAVMSPRHPADTASNARPAALGGVEPLPLPQPPPSAAGPLTKVAGVREVPADQLVLLHLEAGILWCVWEKGGGTGEVPGETHHQDPS